MYLPNKCGLLIILLISLIYSCNSSTHICDEVNACGEQIDCSPDETCIVKCASNQACQHKIINCPANQKCEVHCINPTAVHQCEYITINAATSSSLLVNATMGDSSNAVDTDPRTIQRANIHCPSNGPFTSAQEIACTIICDGDDLFRFANIWAVEGFNDVKIQARQYSKKWCFRNVHIKCKEDFSSNCKSDTDGSTLQPNKCNTVTADRTCDNYTATLPPSNTPTQTTPIPTMATNAPSLNPSINPTIFPTSNPTKRPSRNPTVFPTIYPSKRPSRNPTKIPTISPSKMPTITPTKTPTITPTVFPTLNPTISPSKRPSRNPTLNPTKIPTISPSKMPTITPTKMLTITPTVFPTLNPTISPSKIPTLSPTKMPSVYPTKMPTISPTVTPTKYDEREAETGMESTASSARIYGGSSSTTSMTTTGIIVAVLIAGCVLIICLFVSTIHKIFDIYLIYTYIKYNKSEKNTFVAAQNNNSKYGDGYGTDDDEELESIINMVIEEHNDEDIVKMVNETQDVDVNAYDIIKNMNDTDNGFNDHNEQHFEDEDDEDLVKIVNETDDGLNNQEEGA